VKANIKGKFNLKGNLEVPEGQTGPHGEVEVPGGKIDDPNAPKDIGDGKQVGLDKEKTPIVCASPCAPLGEKYADVIGGLKSKMKTAIENQLKKLDEMVDDMSKLKRTEELTNLLEELKNSKAPGLSNFEVAGEFGYNSYKKLKDMVKKVFGTGSGNEVHHLLEKRFAGTLGEVEDDMLSIVLTKAEHDNFTQAWREAIPYRNSGAIVNTVTATEKQILDAAKKIYKDYPNILKVLGL
jgi:hypothetical protein